MRVFETYYYNIIDKVIYKETKPYLEQMLNELGYSYKNLAFTLYDLRKDANEKVFSKFPTLKKYEFEGQGDYGISSIRENWQTCKIHADEKDLQDVSAVFSKIPRPYNYSFGKLILDQINWFDDSDESIAISDWNYKTDSVPTIFNLPFESNRIIQYRSYDDGKKINNIEVTVEVTKDDGIRDSSIVLKRLEPYIGTYTGFERTCTFNKEEYQKFRELENNHSEKIKVIGNSFLPESNYMELLKKHMNDYIQIPHVADKTTLNKVFKGSRFERIKGQPNWLHLYSFKDSNNYKYDAYIQKISFRNEFRCWLEITGYNFHIKYEHEDYIVEEENVSSDILKVFVQFCNKMIDEYSKELIKDFGKTPDWF